ncbi:MAG: hypothetical protein HYX59_12325 [Elusimicrobia bacterium]|nr:hypothetical protein [Elusimicrobiota bacterium]
MMNLPAVLVLACVTVAHAAEADWSRSAETGLIASSTNALKVAAVQASAAATPAPSGSTTTLSGSDLPTPEERARYEQLLAVDKAEAESYLITRNYVRMAKAIVDSDGVGALDFPGKPKGFAKRHLSADGKDKDTINAAVMLSIKALSKARP